MLQTSENDNKFIKNLILNAQNGNNSAFEQLYEINVERVFSVVLRILASVELAHKVTIDVFVHAWENLKFVRTDMSFASWLLSISVYSSLEKLRAIKKNNENYAQDAIQGIFLKDTLDKRILSLPENERIIFVLNEIENYTIVESADLMGITADTAKQILSRARILLINRLD